jgi:hypothetical protein
MDDFNLSQIVERTITTEVVTGALVVIELTQSIRTSRSQSST